MSLDLRRDLHEYGDFMEETQGSLTVEQILKRSGAIQVIPDDEHDPHHDQTRRRWAAVLAVAAILLTVGVALLLGALRNDVPPVDSVTTTVPPVTETTVVPSAVGPLGWTQATPPSGVEQVEEVWAMTDGGYALWTGSEIWTSVDGMEWELSASTPDPADLSESGSGIDFAGGWLVVSGDSENDPMVAYSANGAAWETTPLPETRGTPLMIAASRSTAVVIGMSPSATAAVAVVWISHDGRTWVRAAEITAESLDGLLPEHLVYTGTEFVMQGTVLEAPSPSRFPLMWRSTDGDVWTEGERYAHGLHYDGRQGVKGLTALDGEPIVLQKADPGYMDTFDDSKFSGWPSGLDDSVSAEPAGGGLGLIVASATDLWFTTTGEVWSRQRVVDVFGSDGEMMDAAVSDVSVLVAFSPNDGAPFDLWLGELIE